MQHPCGTNGGAVAPSLRKGRSKALAVLVAAALLAPVDVPLAAAAQDDREAAYAELVALGEQLNLTRDEAERAPLLERYRALSERSGGDDPAGLLPGRGRLAATGARRVEALGTCATTTWTFTNSTPVPFPAGTALVSSTLVVSGAGPVIYDLDVTTFITHTWNDDIDMTIMSPAGTIVTLTTDNAPSVDNVFNGTVWDDDANPGGQVPYANTNGLVNDQLYMNLILASPLAPEDALAAFDGEDPNGTWTITISDDVAVVDGGVLNSWSLDIETLPAPVLLGAPVTVSNTTPVTIPATAPPNVVTSTVTVPAGAGEIFKVTAVTDITHTNNADLDITLMSPAGTVVTLTTDNGGALDNVFAGTTWDDQADPDGQVPYTSNLNMATDHPYVNLVPATPLVPEEALAAFLGEDAAGTWTLTISDDLNLNGGTLNSWSLNITPGACALTVAAAGLAVDAGGNNVLQPGETVIAAPSWTNTSAVAVAVTGAASNFTGPAGGTYTLVDAAADYGTIGAGATAQCTDCYGVSVTAATRPALHWDTTMDETLAPGGATKTWTLHVGDSFADVPPGNPFYRFIETIFHRQVTGGCGGQNYCPANSTTREQMAVFALISKEGAGYAPAPCVTGAEQFADVPAASPFCRFVEELFNRGVVAGCGGGNYCPGNPVTREQMAVFVLRTLDGTLNPPACAPPNIYGDVPETSGFCRWIEELTNRGVVSGCGGGNYCPANPVTREQMGVFLGLTFGLTLYGV